MSNDACWITARIAQARERHPFVTEAVSARIEGLLNGELSERRPSSRELASIANALIADMVPAPPKAQTKQ